MIVAVIGGLYLLGGLVAITCMVVVVSLVAKETAEEPPVVEGDDVAV